MAVSNPITYANAGVLFGTTDVSDEITTITLTPEPSMAQLQAFQNYVYSAKGVTTWGGEITAVYDNTAGSAYKLLLAAIGGTNLTISLQPAGPTPTSNEEIVFEAVIGDSEIPMEASGEIQVRTFQFMVNGIPTYGTVG